MSANRIVKRTAWVDSQPKFHAYMAAESAAARGVVSKPAKRVTYHEYAISSGGRHPLFQKNIRAARAEHGLQPTSGNMHRVHGRSV